MATRSAIRLAQQEHEGAGHRDAVAEAVSAATMRTLWGDGAATGGTPADAGALDAALRHAVLHRLSTSGIEQRWREATEFQAA